MGYYNKHYKWNELGYGLEILLIFIIIKSIHNSQIECLQGAAYVLHVPGFTDNRWESITMTNKL